MESELWPTVIHEAKAREVPIAVVNGRISERAFGRYRMGRGWVRSMVQAVDLFLMQSREDADRITAPVRRLRARIRTCRESDDSARAIPARLAFAPPAGLHG